MYSSIAIDNWSTYVKSASPTLFIFLPWLLSGIATLIVFGHITNKVPIINPSFLDFVFFGFDFLGFVFFGFSPKVGCLWLFHIGRRLRSTGVYLVKVCQIVATISHRAPADK